QDRGEGRGRCVPRPREPALELVARQVQASASDVTAGRPVRLGLQAALFGAEKANGGGTGNSGPVAARPVRLGLQAGLFGAEKANVSVTGSIGPVADPPVPTETPIDLDWTLHDTDAAALAAAAPLLDVTVPRELIVAGPLSAHGRVQGPADRLAGAATVGASAAALRL